MVGEREKKGCSGQPKSASVLAKAIPTITLGEGPWTGQASVQTQVFPQPWSRGVPCGRSALSCGCLIRRKMSSRARGRRARPFNAVSIGSPGGVRIVLCIIYTSIVLDLACTLFKGQIEILALKLFIQFTNPGLWVMQHGFALSFK